MAHSGLRQDEPVSGVTTWNRDLRTAGSDDETALPSREDNLVRGLTEAVGGPVGEHVARPRSLRSRAAVIVMVLGLLTFTLHWVQKSPCMDGAWGDNHP